MRGRSMTEDDRNALTEIWRGAGVMGIILGSIILGIVILSGGEDVSKLETSAEVVDTYKGCDIVRWNAHGLAEYKYFLHCNNTHPVYEQ
jgi:hypothetical protein